MFSLVICSFVLCSSHVIMYFIGNNKVSGDDSAKKGTQLLQ